MNSEPEGWQTKQHILIILAHPDDPEFFMGATIARWTALGHHITYLLLTCGEKGSLDPQENPLQLAMLRRREEKEAAEVLGVLEVAFLDYPDGMLVVDQDIRRKVVGIIREKKPDVVITSDPTLFFIGDRYINHPDHRAVGQIVLEAIFPAAGNPHYFPELLDRDLQPHPVKEVWFCLAKEPNTTIDVTEYWEIKIQAILKHQSQITNVEQLLMRQHGNRTTDSTDANPRYEDHFRRIIFRVEKKNN